MTDREVYLRAKYVRRRKNIELIMNRLKEVAIGITAGILYLLASGWLYFVTVMAR